MRNLQKLGRYSPPLQLVSSGGIVTAKEGFFDHPIEKKAEPARFAEAVEYARNLSAIQTDVRSLIEDYARQIAEQFVAVQTQTQTRSESVAHKFQELSRQWRTETAHLSSVTKQVMHPSYQRIIGLGPAVLPILLQEVRQQSGYWFWALNAITGEDPVPPEDLGDVPKMSGAWLNWARQRGLI